MYYGRYGKIVEVIKGDEEIYLLYIKLNKR